MYVRSEKKGVSVTLFSGCVLVYRMVRYRCSFLSVFRTMGGASSKTKTKRPCSAWTASSWWAAPSSTRRRCPRMARCATRGKSSWRTGTILTTRWSECHKSSALWPRVVGALPSAARRAASSATRSPMERRWCSSTQMQVMLQAQAKR